VVGRSRCIGLLVDEIGRVGGRRMKRMRKGHVGGLGFVLSFLAPMPLAALVRS
jgi:hypothetical protein